MAQPHFNRAAGFRRTGARKHAKQIGHQTEAAAGIDSAMQVIFDAVHELARAHKKLAAAERELVAANQIASEAEYLPPANAYESEAVSA